MPGIFEEIDDKAKESRDRIKEQEAEQYREEDQSKGAYASSLQYSVQYNKQLEDEIELLRIQNGILERRTASMQEQLTILREIYDAEHKITQEKETQLTIDQKAAQIKLSINSRSGFSGAGMSAATAKDLNVSNANINPDITSANNSGL